jgi:hypothetical protein
MTKAIKVLYYKIALAWRMRKLNKVLRDIKKATK